MEYRIGAEWHGRTVKDYLYTAVGVSRSVLTQLKTKEDGILLNGTRVTVRAVISENDMLSLALSDSGDRRIEKIVPSDIPLSFAYEDDYFYVINKASDMPTHPTHGHYEDTVANALAGHVRRKDGELTVFRAVNRLDRDTSGLVLIAKDQLTAAKLSTTLQQGLIIKEYIAILVGELAENEGEIDLSIRRMSGSIINRECCKKGEGADALTRYRVLARSNGYTLVLASPITGRTHQLRVHFSTIGYPILGDTLYGEASSMINRQALHAYRLQFPHPISGKMLDIRALPPEDMMKCIKEIKIDEIVELDKT